MGGTDYCMRCIAASGVPRFTTVVNHGAGERVGIRLNHPRRSDGANERLKGVSRLVNPKPGDPELVSGEEDQGERDYLGRILHVADEVLHAKGTRARSRRNSRAH